MNRYGTENLPHGFDIYRLQKNFLSPVPAHFHNFHKIIFLWRGEAHCVIEGKNFLLQPKDVIFISAGEVHFPVLKKDTLYDATILCIAPELLRYNKRGAEDLAKCFYETKGSEVRHMVTNNPLLINELNQLERNANPFFEMHDSDKLRHFHESICATPAWNFQSEHTFFDLLLKREFESKICYR